MEEMTTVTMTKGKPSVEWLEMRINKQRDDIRRLKKDIEFMYFGFIIIGLSIIVNTFL